MFSILWNRFRNVVLTLKSQVSQRDAAGPDHRRGTLLHAECLEQRQMLSANQISLNTTTSALVIQGTTGADNALVWTDAANVVHVSLVTPTESLSATYARSSVSSVQFVGDAGNDRFENSTNIDGFATGGAGDDVLIGGTGTNMFLGGAGNDQLIGSIGVDTLFGDDGNDWIAGGAGNDQIDGGLGDDTIVGGAGDDSIFGNDGADSLFGEDGNDWVGGGNGNDYLEGGLGDNTLTGNAGDDRLIGSNGIDTLNGEDGNDYLSGGTGNDQLDGGLGDDTLLGGAGDDGLYGSDGADTLLGEDGNDYLSAGAGNNQLDGGLGDDTLVGGSGNDALLGNDGADMLYGNDGNDWVAGGNGNDYVEGGLGNDILAGGAGDDTLNGGDGADKLYGDERVLTAGDYVIWRKTFVRPADYDTWRAYSGETADSGAGGNDHLDGGAGNDYLEGGRGDDTLVGGAGDDQADSGLGDDTLFGGAGNDQLYGNIGVDNLFGDDGNDYLSGGAGNDQLDGGFGDDTLVGDAGDDYLFGNDGADALFGEDGNDWVGGGNGNDYLEGGLGDNTLTGNAGDDRLYGSSGIDTLDGEDGNDYLAGGAGNDQLDGGLGDDALLGGAGDDQLLDNDGADTLFGEDGNDSLASGNGNDYLSGGAGNDQLDGGFGDDTLVGDAGDDYLFGNDGADALFGDDGNDWLGGGNGNDYLEGGLGNNTLTGNAGDDRLYGSSGIDTLNGEDGNDYLAGGAGDDQLNGGLGDDALVGGDGDDQLTGDDGMDSLLGENGNDALFGQNGSDLLVGGNGADTLFAGIGNDVLIGGTGVDQLSGEAGDDLLIGASTESDGNLTRLQAIAAAWSNGSPYAARVQAITDAFFTANVSDGDDPTVHTTAAGGHLIDDQVSDLLSGGSDQDWFLESGYMPMYLPSDVDSAQQTNANSLVQCGDQIMYLTNQVPQIEGFSLYDSLDTAGDRQSSEILTSMVPKATDISMAKEHLALMQLVRYDQVTNYAVRSGDWSDPATWHGGVVPASGARVLIPVGVEVSVDGLIPARLATVRVDGTLSFDTARNTQLQVDTLVVSDCGELEMGTAENPISQGVTARLFITDNGAINRSWDPFGISRGLISQGSVSIYGTAVTSSTTLAVQPVAGTQILALSSVPVGWKAGDSVVIAATTEGAAQNESRVILSIVGNVVSLDRALSYSHVSPAADLQVNIANVTRNAVIESESTAFDRRGHVMFMHNPDVNIAYAGFYKLGRTDKSQPINDPVVTSNWTLQPGTGTNPRARYAVHFHRTGTVDDGDPATIMGSAVVDSPGWGFVNHSSYVDMTNNVAFNVRGAAFVTEVGDEIGGFYGNLAIGTTGSNADVNSRFKIQDFGFGGDGFWFQGSGVSVVGNISAGNQGSAFIYYTLGLFGAKFPTANLVDPSIAAGAASIPADQVPVRQFTNNVGYASHTGLMVRYHLQNATAGQSSLFENSTFWNDNMGVYVPYSENLVLRNLKVIGGQVVKPEVGIDVNDKTKNVTYENLTVSGYNHGIHLPRKGNVVVNGGTFTNNNQDIAILSGEGENRSALITGNFTQLKIQTLFDINPIENSTAAAFMINDLILLNYGNLVNRRLYNLMQQASAIPFPNSRADIPANYVGLTNQQLWNLYGVAFGGAIAPSNAVTVPNIIGLVAPAV